MSIRRMVLVLAVSAPLMVGCGGDGGIPAPSNLEIQGFSTTSVSLVWTGNAADYDGYRVYRSTDGSTFTEIDTTFFESYNDNTVSQGTLYYYRVTVYKDTEESGFSNTVSVTPEDYYVTLLTPNGGETLTIGQMYDITWETNMPGFDAVIRLSTDGGSTWEPVEFSWAPNESPYPWEVGYGWVYVGPNPDDYEWQQIVASTETDCLIYIEDYEEGATVSDESDAVFTIQP